MATSVIAFSDASIASNKNKDVIEANFTPPSNISGEHCYVECTYFGWDYTTAPSPTLNTRDTITLTTNWSQSVSATVSSGDTSTQGTRPYVASGCICNNVFYSHGPILCFIPDGPQSIEFTISKTDGGEIVGDTTNVNYFYAVFKIVPANSRQPPIGV